MYVVHVLRATSTPVLLHGGRIDEKKKHLLTLCRADWTRVNVKLTADPKAQVPNRRDVRGAPVL